ncbi:glyoxalase domain-containing protein 4 [Drosophila gunungcola]|uniref:glyoxalase domain-containing protein 4 n=1 Tax=Drosophila gunungcola TaxID=103775 RepID=UPI0022E412AC|nr:glyoxalase domain-containing protein 4 [Drosophila gunungcola]
MSAISGRALHYVFKIGDRAKNSFFFRQILGMTVLRHEEFKEGCDAACNGPYDNRWSKTMVGYGPESSHFVIELTYNYGVSSYEMGNDFGGVVIHSKDILSRAAEHSYPVKQVAGRAGSLLTSPDGYKFFVIDDQPPANSDPVQSVELNVSDLKKSRKYWHDLLRMNVLEESEGSLRLSYGGEQASLQITQIAEPLNRAKAYGRIAFAIPTAQQPPLEEAVKAAGGAILTPLITLDTPGKATVSVVILGDPDGHEICFVDEEGFGALSQVEPDGAQRLDNYIGKDPFQQK